MDLAPSMVQRSGDKLIVRRVVSGEQVHLGGSPPRSADEQDEQESDQQDQQDQHQHHHRELLLDGWRREFSERSELGQGLGRATDPESEDASDVAGGSVLGTDDAPTADQSLPQCKIKRNYSCGRCSYFTQNPREYLTHLRDVHSEKIVINECKRCLYASRHYQKLVRHMKMVHGSVDGIRKSAFGSRRRMAQKSGVGFGGTRLGTDSGMVSGSKIVRASETDQLTSAYVQQLVANGLPKLLEEIEKSGGNPASLASNFALQNSIFQVDLEQLGLPLPYATRGDKITREASTGEDAERSDVPALEEQSHHRTEDSLKAKRRARPVPNLIPLNLSSPAAAAPSTSANHKSFVKPLPLSALTDAVDCEQGQQDVPISLTKHEPAETPTTKCIYCELSFKTVEALANHIKLAHKEDLIAYLLASSFDDASPRTTSETWRRLLVEGSGGGSSSSRSRDEGVKPSGTSSSSGGSSVQVQPTTGDETDEESREDGQPHQSQTFCGVETAPGYGEVTNRVPTVDATAGGTAVMKKVFKCPHCSFWASTASRFHVHIVGHLNKKPFECSLCAYRSNWRWDITKHIRLKTIRDPSHKSAGVLMNDETGRRNYTKYNKYIALMQITDK